MIHPDDFPTRAQAEADDHVQQLGLGVCPSCEYPLEVADWYADEMPPIPRPRTSTIVVRDPEENEVPVNHDIDECPNCGESIGPESIVFLEEEQS